VGEGKRVMIVDDEADVRATLEMALAPRWEVVTAGDAGEALARFVEFSPDVVLTDLRLPGMSGLALLQRMHRLHPECAVVVFSGSGGTDAAVAAIRQGAADFVAKPIRLEKLDLVLDQAIEWRLRRANAQELGAVPTSAAHIETIVGSAPALERVRRVILRIASTRATVLVTGESGTGKELAAAAIHEHSPRAGRPFVKLHCASLAPALLESELFGHERGAFTGATGKREGRLQQAHGGTLFLDEIGEIAPTVQVKLLRFLQERELERVGGNKTFPVDVRVIAATNRDLRAEVRAGRFREDLFYRLNVVQITMPPLRALRQDIGRLAERFLREAAQSNGRHVLGFSELALDRLVRHTWPGNVRELQNAVERAVVMTTSNYVQVGDLPELVAPLVAGTMPPVPGATLAEIERYVLLRTFEECGGSSRRAADVLKIDAGMFQKKLGMYLAEDDEVARGSQVDDDEDPSKLN
jgi:DNA-binding NtrC family response regulator